MIENDTVLLPRPEMVRAWKQRDAGYDGVFYIAVRTTGIVCRPSCPSRPQLENLEFFRSLGAAISAGYRPCKRCRPELSNGQPPRWAQALIDRVSADPESRITAGDLRKDGLTPEKVRRWFRENHGMTFAAWCRGNRLASAFTSIRRGDPLDDVILGHGFESHSGFREAFSRAFGKPPGKSRSGKCILITFFSTPVGPMLAAADDAGICFLEFADRRGLETNYAQMRKRFGLPVVPGDNKHLDQLKVELTEYFEGKRRTFSSPVNLLGTTFQKKVWNELQRIPFGRTASYAEIAARVGKPSAVRAVARANGTNRLCILVPCHRVIGSDGSLSGYGGGVWRKRFLLNLERGPA